MSPEMLVLLMVGAFFTLLLIGVPLAWVMLSLGLIFGWLGFGPSVVPLTLMRFWDIMGSFSLLAIPLFIFMANMLSSSGIADDLFKTLHRWMGGLRGGLGIATVVTCAVLAAMVGTGGAGITIMGLIALPAMLAHSYDRTLAMGSIMAGGSLGYMIPPSIMFILYGQFAGVSIGGLFMAGILPGLLLVVLYAGYIWLCARLKPELAPCMPLDERVGFLEKLAMARSLALPLLLVVFVLGSIYLGMATVSEAAGVAAAGSILASAIQRRLTLKSLFDALVSTMKTVGVIMWITLSAYVFAGVVQRLGAGRMLVELLQSFALGPWEMLIALILILVLLGMIIDVIALVVLTVPIFVPVVVALGFDPLWFGIIFTMTIQMAFLSPPFGYGMFYLKAVAPSSVTTLELYKAVAPFIGLQAIALILIIIWPAIATTLPTLMR